MLLRSMEQKHERGGRDSIECVSHYSRYYRICSWFRPAKAVISTPILSFLLSTLN